MPDPLSFPEETRHYTLESYFEPLPLAKFFPEPSRPLEVEIGCGSGSFLAQYAAIQRDHNFIGIERLLGRIRKLDKKARRADLTNLTIVRVEAAYAVEYLLPAASVDAYHIYFPDPWPKKRHTKKRLITPDFLALVEKTLKPNGCLFLRTDNEPYYEQMGEAFAEHPQFEPIEAAPELTEVVTDFEQGFNAEGIPTLRRQYRLR